MVFLDYMGLFMLIYPDWLSEVICFAVALVAAYTIFDTLKVRGQSLARDSGVCFCSAPVLRAALTIPPWHLLWQGGGMLRVLRNTEASLSPISYSFLSVINK